VTAAGGHRRAVLHRRAVRLEWFTVSWNVVEAVVAIGAGILAGSAALIGFGADSGIEIVSAVGLLWRLDRAGPDADVHEERGAERTALLVVAATFVLLAGYIAYEAGTALAAREEPDTSVVGLVLAATSLLIMPVLAYAKSRTGKEMGSRALRADAVETWVCSYLSLALLFGTGAYLAFGWWWADPAAALGMLPVVVWQGWETLQEARERGDDE
jgi:cation diffusion facilitator family transporter